MSETPKTQTSEDPGSTGNLDPNFRGSPLEEPHQKEAFTGTLTKQDVESFDAANPVHEIPSAKGQLDPYAELPEATKHPVIGHIDQDGFTSHKGSLLDAVPAGAIPVEETPKLDEAHVPTVTDTKPVDVVGRLNPAISAGRHRAPDDEVGTLKGQFTNTEISDFNSDAQHADDNWDRIQAVVGEYDGVADKRDTLDNVQPLIAEHQLTTPATPEVTADSAAYASVSGNLSDQDILWDQLENDPDRSHDQPYQKDDRVYFFDQQTGLTLDPPRTPVLKDKASKAAWSVAGAIGKVTEKAGKVAGAAIEKFSKTEVGKKLFNENGELNKRGRNVVIALGAVATLGKAWFQYKGMTSMNNFNSHATAVAEGYQAADAGSGDFLPDLTQASEGSTGTDHQTEHGNLTEGIDGRGQGPDGVSTETVAPVTTGVVPPVPTGPIQDIEVPVGPSNGEADVSARGIGEPASQFAEQIPNDFKLEQDDNPWARVRDMMPADTAPAFVDNVTRQILAANNIPYDAANSLNPGQEIFIPEDVRELMRAQS